VTHHAKKAPFLGQEDGPPRHNPEMPHRSALEKLDLNRGQELARHGGAG
jgi:hypothetical protein